MKSKLLLALLLPSVGCTAFADECSTVVAANDVMQATLNRNAQNTN